jgi:hypothetical protein
MAPWMWLLHPSMSFLAIICCAASTSFEIACATRWPLSYVLVMFPSGRSWACSATRAILLELLNYARFRPNYLGRAVQAIDAYFADLRKELGHLLPDAVFNPMHASSVLVPKGGGPQRLEKMVGATGIEPVTPAMSTQCSYR